MPEKPEKKYSLCLLFDSSQITPSELKSRIEDVLKKYLSDIELSIKPNHSKFIELNILGSRETLDKCHKKINKILLDKGGLTFIRLRDEVGDEVRKQAYSILADIEQRFRTFINRALVEVRGFNWGESLAPSKIREHAESIRGKHQNNDFILDFLECTQFDHLIDLVTAEVSEWSKEKEISVYELSEILSDCTSILDINKKIQDKLKYFSFWDVFSVYFEDLESWEKLKKDSINCIINERHKVMHHRPIRLGAIQMLETKRIEIFRVLDSAKLELSEPEAIEAMDILEGIMRSGSEISKRQKSTLESVATILESLKSQIAIDSVAQQVARNSQLLKSQIAIDSVAQQVARNSYLLKSQIAIDSAAQQVARNSHLLKSKSQ
ncbi:hypothetical protein, partial [Spirulina sp. 06S082]|uniref:hypothetical protein n=1 Tax=Spirulina sp. 06S082 TaxID=3110248 RepID=UPI002B1F2999